MGNSDSGEKGRKHVINAVRREESLNRSRSLPAMLAAGSPSFNRKVADKYGCIPDIFKSFEQVQIALRTAGLESSNLIVAVDFTKSNEWAGQRTFGNQCLHKIGSSHNPYEQAISVIGQTLATFDDDNLIPCFGFGDVTTHDQNAFSFLPNNEYCRGFEEVMSRYRQIAPQVRLAGPTSFAPVIDQAVRIVEQSGGQYHVLLIIADGQVTRSVDTHVDLRSVQEQATVDSIVNASNYALSIIMIGVGDGPWDIMESYDDNIPHRNFDNFQFVNFAKVMNHRLPQAQREAHFALAALMEIPEQYKACQELNIIGKTVGYMPTVLPLPPPPTVPPAIRPLANASLEPSVLPSTTSYYQESLCPICLNSRKDLAFQCGHQTCRHCGSLPSLSNCPICRTPIAARIKLYS